VTTNDVDLIKDISNQIFELIKNEININISSRYYFTKFADLRTKMIAEATQSARQAAVQFSKDSGSRVGVIRQAVQGAFSITSPNDEYNELSSIYKKIRVVTTVTFNLVD
ncbi:MAG: SIMPL domain-containing protein, partial [Gammaproteobacteria bacterium]